MPCSKPIGVLQQPNLRNYTEDFAITALVSPNLRGCRSQKNHVLEVHTLRRILKLSILM